LGGLLALLIVIYLVKGSREDDLEGDHTMKGSIAESFATMPSRDRQMEGEREKEVLWWSMNDLHSIQNTVCDGPCGSMLLVIYFFVVVLLLISPAATNANCVMYQKVPAFMPHCILAVT